MISLIYIGNKINGLKSRIIIFSIVRFFNQLQSHINQKGKDEC